MATRKLQHNDEPVFDGSLLQRDAFVRTLAEQIAACTPPQVFGVHGEWGAGKTSVLRQLQRHLSDPELTAPADIKAAQNAARVSGRPEPSHYSSCTFTIWFEAWRYQHEAMPLIALLQEMRRQFSLAMKVKGAVKAGSVMALKTLTGAFDTVAGLVGAESAKLFNPGNIIKAAESYDTANFRARLPTDTVREFLETAIDELLVGLKRDSAENPRLVVFIDDLDRCSSDAAYRLLEGLKIHLNLPNCVFVLGMNQGAVIDLLAPHFSKKGDDELAERRAESYLEKLCANVWRLPPVRDPLQLLSHWLYIDLTAAPGGVSIGEKVLQQRFTAMTNIDLMRRSLPPNPRKLKALANTMLALWDGGAKQALADNDQLTFQCFVFLAYVYQFHQGLYQRWVLAPDFFETMKEWAKGTPMLPDRKAIFAGLRLTAAQPLPTAADEKTTTTPVTSAAAQSLYPEPGQHGLFWMTPWLLHPQGGALATSGLFMQLLMVHQGQTTIAPS